VLSLTQPALTIEVAPVMHHVGVNSMLPRHSRYRRPRQHRLLHDLALLGDASPLPLEPFYLSIPDPSTITSQAVALR
jgi:hypothetical protein